MATFSDERIKKILLGRRAVTRVKFPLSDDVEVGIRSLADRQIDQAHLDAVVYLESGCKSAHIDMTQVVVVDPDRLEREKHRQILALACVDPDAPEKPFFDSVKQVRDLDSAMVSRLYGIYLSHLEAVNPRRTLTQEQERELVDALKKEPMASAILEDIERGTLVALVRILVSQQPT